MVARTAREGTSGGGLPGDLRRKVLVSLLLGLAVIIGVAFLADLPRTLEALGRFDWRLLPVALLCVLWNYLLRLFKWQFYLRQVGVQDLKRVDSGMIYLSGLSMVVTPGRVGEWLKSYLLREYTGTAFSVSAPIVVAERLTDAVSMLVLASVGLFAYGYGGPVLALALVGAVAVVYFTQHRAAARAVFNLLRPLPAVSSRLDSLRAFYDSSYRLFRPRSLGYAIALGVVSWFGECLAFFFVLVGLGITATPSLVLSATFVLATATIAGSLSMLPGGLAAAEGSLAGLLVLLAVTNDAGVAAAATLLVRLCTLWFGVLVGVAALALIAPRLSRLRARPA